jgi:hypothetical protein
MKRALVSALLLICMAGPGSEDSYAQNHSGNFEAVGEGVPDTSSTNRTQRQAMACDAALVQAQAKMLSLLQSRSSDNSTDPEKLRTRILKGAYIVKTERAPNGVCRITLRMKQPA